MKQISHVTLHNKHMPWWKEEIYGSEIMGMRLLRKKSVSYMQKVADKAMPDTFSVRFYEKDHTLPVPPPLAAIYMIELNCQMHHVYQFREILDGKRKDFNDSRTIGKRLKDQVYKKCKSRCVLCKSDENLHIHHIKEYAKGGRTELSNLTLLCASCHADTHKDNNSYYLLKKAAGGNADE